MTDHADSVMAEQIVVATKAGVATAHRDPDRSINVLIVWARGDSCVVHVPPGVLRSHFKKADNSKETT